MSPQLCSSPDARRRCNHGRKLFSPPPNNKSRLSSVNLHRVSYGLFVLGCVSAKGESRNLKPDIIVSRSADARCKMSPHASWSANSGERGRGMLWKSPQRRRAWQRMRVKTTCSLPLHKNERDGSERAGDNGRDGFVVSLRDRVR